MSGTAEATNFKFGVQIYYKEYYQKYKIREQKGRSLGHVTYFFNFETPLISLERLYI